MGFCVSALIVCSCLLMKLILEFIFIMYSDNFLPISYGHFSMINFVLELSGLIYCHCSDQCDHKTRQSIHIGCCYGILMDVVTFIYHYHDQVKKLIS